MIKLTQTTMTANEWLRVADCPIQRDTEEHAKKARNKHLKTASPTHSRVSAAQLPDGEIYKLDGHTRALLWKDGSLEAPPYLFVDMYMVDFMSEVEDLYKQFDNSDAVETASDKLRGAFRLHGFKPESGLILFGGLTSAITVLDGKSKSNIYSSITPWMEAIKLIDGCGFTNTRFTAGVLAAALLTAQIYGAEATEFWVRFANDDGRKTADGRDGVQALSDLLVDKRARRQLAGRENIMEILSKAISCFEKDRKGEKYAVGIKQTDWRAYMESKLRGKQALAA